jgi:hypothetical protein
MKTQCPICHTVYRIDEKELPSKAIYATCKSCKTRFSVNNSTDPKTSNLTDSSTDSDSILQILSRNLKSRKKLLIYSIIALIILGVFLARQQYLKNPSVLANKIQPSVVTIHTYDFNGKPLKSGSGFIINKEGHIVTNHHVLYRAYRAEIKTHSGEKYPIRLVLNENESADLIKVSADLPLQELKWLEIDESKPKLAEKILVMGSPLGLEQTVSEGIVSSIRKLTDKGTIYQISAPISSGSSGSPVVNANGKVIGVVTSTIVNGQNLNFAVPAQYISGMNNYSINRPIDEVFALYSWHINANPNKENIFGSQDVIDRTEVVSDGWKIIGKSKNNVNLYKWCWQVKIKLGKGPPFEPEPPPPNSKFTLGAPVPGLTKVEYVLFDKNGVELAKDDLLKDKKYWDFHDEPVILQLYTTTEVYEHKAIIPKDKALQVKYGEYRIEF